MTALTSKDYDATLTNEMGLRVAVLSGPTGNTFTPTNAAGKTIKILSITESSTVSGAYGSGTALTATPQGAGTTGILITTTSGDAFFNLIYALV